jgi:hypothetical protein
MRPRRYAHPEVGGRVGVHLTGALDVRLDWRIRNAFEVVIPERHESIGDDLFGMGIGDAAENLERRKYHPF